MQKDQTTNKGTRRSRLQHYLPNKRQEIKPLGEALVEVKLGSHHFNEKLNPHRLEEYWTRVERAKGCSELMELSGASVRMKRVAFF